MKAEFAGWDFMNQGDKEPVAFFRIAKEYKGRVIGYKHIVCSEELADRLEIGEEYEITENGELA